MKTNKAVFTAKLPDGSMITRKSAHDYSHVCAFRITELATGEDNGWGAQFASSAKLAESRARAWHNCPDVKMGRITVETRVIPVTNNSNGGTK